MNIKTITEIKNRAHKNAVNRGFYDCKLCNGNGFENVYNPEIDEKETIDCTKCWGEINQASQNIIVKLKEEVSEFEEATTTARTADGELLKCCIEDIDIAGDEWIQAFEYGVKNTTGDELADVIIIALGGAVEMGIDIESHLMAKLRYNEVRKDHETT